MNITKYGIVNGEYTTVEGAEKLLNAEKLGSLLDISDSSEIEIITPTIKVLSKTLNGITQLLNTIQEKGIHFKSLEDDIDSENQREFDLFVKHLNTCNSIALEQAYEREQQIRIGGKKRGKRETFQFPSDWQEIYERMITGQMTKTEITEHYGISRQSVYVWINRYEKQLREQNRK